jgi:hypothetical protein
VSDLKLERMFVTSVFRKGHSYDPEIPKQRIESKMSHNIYRDHTVAVYNAAKFEEGWQPVEWGTRFKFKDGGYQLAVDEFLQADVDTRSGHRRVAV